LSNILITKLKGKGRNWPLFVPSTLYAYNSSPHTILEGFSPFELLFGRPPRDPLGLDTDLLTNNLPKTVQEYAISLKARLANIGELATNFHNKHQKQISINRAREINRKPVFQVGDMIYLLFPRAGSLNTGTLKWKTNYIGPLMITSLVDDRLVTLSDLSGKAMYGVHSIKRLKRAYFNVKGKAATNIQDIQEAIDKLEEYRKNNTNQLQSNPSSMFCMSDGTVPAHVDLNICLTSDDPTDQHVFLAKENSNCLFEPSKQAFLDVQKKGENRLDLRRERRMPLQDEILVMKVAAYEDDNLKILLADSRGKFQFWQPIDAKNYKERSHLIVKTRDDELALMSKDRNGKTGQRTEYVKIIKQKFDTNEKAED